MWFLRKKMFGTHKLIKGKVVSPENQAYNMTKVS